MLYEIATTRPDEQPMAGATLAAVYAIVWPRGARWQGAGAYMQVIALLSGILQAPLERYLRVQSTIVPTGDGMQNPGRGRGQRTARDRLPAPAGRGQLAGCHLGGGPSRDRLARAQALQALWQDIPTASPGAEMV